MEIKILNSLETWKLFNKDSNKNGEVSNFKFLNLKYLDSDQVLCCFIKGIPCGVIQFGFFSNDKKTYIMKFVSVHPNYRQQGVSKALIYEFCSFVVKNNGYKIKFSSYEKEGEVLIQTVKEIANNFPEINLQHRVIGGNYQNAKYPLLKEGDLIVLDINDQEKIGTVLYFDYDLDTYKIIVKIGTECVSVDHSLIKKKM